MNITDGYGELLSSIVNSEVNGSTRVQVKEIRLDEDASGEKVLVATFDMETLYGRDELNVAAKVSRDILRADNSGVSSYFPMVAEVVKKKIAELFNTKAACEWWIRRNYPNVNGALQAYSAMGGVYRTEYVGGATNVNSPVIVTLDPDGDYVPVILHSPSAAIRENEMVALAGILRHIEQRNKPSVS